MATPTELFLGRVASEHVNADGWCQSDDCTVRWPCDAAKLYALVVRQSALMAEWGLPCACDTDFDLPALEVPHAGDGDSAAAD